MSQWMQDMRYVLRQLRKSLGFTLTAILTLTLGIGATTAMYRVVEGVLLAPLPYPAQDRLVGVAFTFPQEKPNAEEAGTTADFIKQHSRSFASVGIAKDGTSGVNLAVGTGRASQIASLKVDRDYFPTLGVQPILGRNFSAEEDLPNGPKTVMLSYLLWKRKFNGDPGILNRTVRINEESYTVAGVMPASLDAASESAPGVASTVDIWQPLQMSTDDPGYGGSNYQMVARLRDGVNTVQAQQELSTLNRPFYKQFPNYMVWTNQAKALHEFRLWPLQQVVVSGVRTSLLTMLAAVLAVLLVACLNLAVLMTARTWRRAREMAVRSALGASRANLLRLMMCESLVLALVGGGLGLWLSRLAVPMLLRTAPIAIPPIQKGTWLSAGFALLIACVTTLIFGLLPGWNALRRNAGSALQGGNQVGTSAHQAKLGNGLMIGQVAVAMVLLSASFLLLGSFLKLRSVGSGVEAKNLTVAQVTLKGDAYATTLHTTQFIDKVVEELAHYPGVSRVAAVNGLPLDRGLNDEGKPANRPGPQENAEYRAVTPGYFRTLGIPLLGGRDVTADDGANTVPIALVSETAARRWWPDRSAIGEMIDTGGGELRRVVGVVGDTHGRSLAEAPRVTIYEPFTQLSDQTTKVINGWFPTTFAMRLSGNMDIAAAVQRAVSNADPEIPVAKLTTMQTVIDHTVAAPRFFSYLAGGFAGFALLLTMIGLFGLMSYQVTQRTREIGVRLAVGATRGQILLLVLRRSLVLAIVGLLIGAISSLAVPQLVGSVLGDYIFTGGEDISRLLSSNTTVLIMAAIAMLAATLAASYPPAQRAASIEPTQALRTE
ncbi:MULTISPECIES: ADOP family duplicated permease [Acidobacteriaceae]|uniref:ADOP family duplicated permease n=1 Tax=Acidobacteriaceae TaxID=204434 RepID=UPI00131D770F|nr:MULTISPECIES: ADOP family duplicated permease [Acidobacteriaceae]MDW5267306.1 ADOP family duplicated permease [Edaphobacter sp.]